MSPWRARERDPLWKEVLGLGLRGGFYVETSGVSRLRGLGSRGFEGYRLTVLQVECEVEGVRFWFRALDLEQGDGHDDRNGEHDGLGFRGSGFKV